MSGHLGRAYFVELLLVHLALDYFIQVVLIKVLLKIKGHLLVPPHPEFQVFRYEFACLLLQFQLEVLQKRVEQLFLIVVLLAAVLQQCKLGLVVDGLHVLDLHPLFQL